MREHSSHGRRRKPRRVIVDPLAPPVSADLLVFSAETPQDAILLLRRLQDNNFKKALNTLSVGSIPAVVAAAQHGNVEALAELLQKGASIHSLRDDISRLTPLHEAVRHGHSHLTRFLLSQGAHQSYVDQAGHTPLHLACINGDVECIRALSADKSQARFKNALGCEDKNRRKPHHSCSNSYCEAIVEDLPGFRR